MTPYYSRDGVTIYCGDYKDIISSFEKWTIGSVITDPPFNVGKDFCNDNLLPLDFRAFFNRFALEIYRLQPLNILVEVGKDDLIARQELERYFNFEYSLCLNYTNSMRNGKVGYANWGLVLWFSNSGRVYNRYKDRLDSALHNTKDEFEHPSPKEISHYWQLVRMFAPPELSILDPFMGTGTTLIAAMNEGRQAIGIDINEDYCQIAVDRLREPSFFSLPQMNGNGKVKAQQLELIS